MRFLRSKLRLGFVAHPAMLEGRLDGRPETQCADEIPGQVPGSRLSGPFDLAKWDELFASGVTSVFLRSQGLPLGEQALENARAVAALCRERDVYLFTIDDAILALRLDATGVLFRNIVPNVARVRAFLGEERFLGAEISSMMDIERLRTQCGPLSGFDFFGVGPVFKYGDKEMGNPLGTTLAASLTRELRQSTAGERHGAKETGAAARSARAAVFWLGGIRPCDIATLGEDFGDGIAVARTLESADMNDVRKLHQALAKFLGPCDFSVGVPPERVAFRFSDLSVEELRSPFVPAPRVSSAH